MAETGRNYVPAAGHHWALWLYDPMVKLMGGDSVRKALLDRAVLRPGQHVLDIGCGTGTLVVLIKRLHPGVEAMGIDPDPKALARGRRKAERAAVTVRFEPGFSDDLPCPDATIDHVFCSFMYHHLQAGEKEKMLREVRRVLAPGGLFHMLDFGGPGPSSKGWLARRLHSSERLKDNSEESVLALMNRAGLANPKRVGQQAMRFGKVVFYQAAAPASATAAADGSGKEPAPTGNSGGRQG